MGGGHIVVVDTALCWHWPNGCLAMVAVVVVLHPLTRCWLWPSVSIGVVVVVVSTPSFTASGWV